MGAGESDERGGGVCERRDERVLRREERERASCWTVVCKRETCSRRRSSSVATGGFVTTLETDPVGVATSMTLSARSASC